MMTVLWLASWYPNKIDPLEGDFIQRHAQATSLHLPVTVIYVAQYGENVPVEEDCIEIKKSSNLTEIIVFFRFKALGLKLIDKIRYNLKYYSAYKQAIRKFFSGNEKPAWIHVHVPMKAGKIAQWISRKWKIPYIVSEHAATYTKGAPDWFENRSVYYQKTVTSIFKKASLVTSVSRDNGTLLKKKFHLKKVEVVHNVVNDQMFNYNNAAGSPLIFEFVHVSTMGYQKNVAGILQAFGTIIKTNDQWRLTLVGPADPGELNTPIESLGLAKNITFAGAISNQEVARYMQASSALILFSRYENFPCVIVEALCCGLPVVTSDVGGIREAVNESNGILVASEDVGALTQAIAHLIENYSKFNRMEIATSAKKRYAYDVIGKTFLKLYNETDR